MMTKFGPRRLKVFYDEFRDLNSPSFGRQIMPGINVLQAISIHILKG
jgi:hypothetical protein